MSPARKSSKRKRKPAALPPRGESPATALVAERSQKLGTKHLCFSCHKKFYDLNKPEPVCPRCGANQTEKPKEPKVPALSPPPRKERGRDITPLLREDDREEPESLDDADEVDTSPDASLFDKAEDVADDDET
jgi:hypothetical protein